MPTTNKGLEQPATNSTNWDVPLNANFGYIDSALGGTTTKSVTGVGTTPVTLTVSEYRSLILNFTGTLTANVTYQVPSGVGGQWTISNNTTGSFTLTIRTSAAAGSVTIPTGARSVVYSDGTSVYSVASSAAGSVSSVNVSGGTTGLTATGGPITSSGTITLGGTLAVANGGTGATTAATARTNLGLGTIATQDASAVSITGGTITGSTVSGGTIATGTVWTYSTPVSSVDFTGIPSWAKRVTVILNGVSTNGTALPLVQVGAGSIVTTGYVSSAATSTNSPSSATNGILLAGTSGGGAALTYSTVLTLVNISSNTWVASTCGGCTNFSASFGPIFGGGTTPNLSGSLDRIRLTTTGTDTFDAGSVNIMWS